MHALMRVLTLNVWNKQGPYAERLPRLRRALAALDADIVGLQEILRLERAAGDARPDGPDNNQACEIAEGLPYFTAFGPASVVGGAELGGGLTFGNAVLSRWPITHAQNFRLPGEPGQEPRALLYVRIDSPHGAVPFFVTHLDWQFHHGFVRERQVAFIADRIQELAPARREDFPAILVGDFNAEPDSDEIRYLQGLTSLAGKSVYFADCFRVAGDGSPGTTFSKRNPFAAALGEPERRIDYIFSRGPDRQQRGRPLSCRVVCDVADNDLFPTDHFGVLADLSVGPAPPPA
jgi:endonuclease/exonuclease/phosphatase family metal-dependent hydrolase